VPPTTRRPTAADLLWPDARRNGARPSSSGRRTGHAESCPPARHRAGSRERSDPFPVISLVRCWAFADAELRDTDDRWPAPALYQTALDLLGCTRPFFLPIRSRHPHRFGSSSGRGALPSCQVELTSCLGRNIAGLDANFSRTRHAGTKDAPRQPTLPVRRARRGQELTQTAETELPCWPHWKRHGSHTTCSRLSRTSADKRDSDLHDLRVKDVNDGAGDVTEAARKFSSTILTI
jgi:hypothetical protein